MISNIFSKKNKESSNLIVTERIISYGGQTWAVRNITTVGKYKITESNTSQLLPTLRAIAILILSYFFQKILGSTIVGIAMVGSCLFLIYAFWRFFLKRPKYGLKLVSSSGESELLTSSDEKFIDLLVKQIANVIQSDKPSNLTINVDNSTIYDNLKNVMIGSNLTAGGNIGIGDTQRQ